MRGAMIFGKFVDKQGNPWEIGQSVGVATVIGPKDLMRSPLRNGLNMLMMSQMDFGAMAKQVTEQLQQKKPSPPAEKKPTPPKKRDDEKRQHGGWTTHDDFRNKYRPKFIGTSPGMSLPSGEGPHTNYHMLFPSKARSCSRHCRPATRSSCSCRKKSGKRSPKSATRGTMSNAPAW